MFLVWDLSNKLSSKFPMVALWQQQSLVTNQSRCNLNALSLAIPCRWYYNDGHIYRCLIDREHKNSIVNDIFLSLSWVRTVCYIVFRCHNIWVPLSIKSNCLYDHISFVYECMLRYLQEYFLKIKLKFSACPMLLHYPNVLSIMAANFQRINHYINCSSFVPVLSLQFSILISTTRSCSSVQLLRSFNFYTIFLLFPCLDQTLNCQNLCH